MWKKIYNCMQWIVFGHASIKWSVDHDVNIFSLACGSCPNNERSNYDAPPLNFNAIFLLIVQFCKKLSELGVHFTIFYQIHWLSLQKNMIQNTADPYFGIRGVSITPSRPLMPITVAIFILCILKFDRNWSRLSL